MAAGSNVYSSEKETIQENGTLYDLFYAKELSAYGSVDNVKALFYLDYVFQSVVAGENVFVGGVRENSDNYYYHKNTRLSVFGQHLDGTNYILLNDAGLNTFAKISGRVYEDIRYANYVKFLFSVKSSYYSVTIDYGFYIRHTNNQGTLIKDWQKYSKHGGPIPSNGTLEDFQIIRQISHTQGDILEVRPYVTNDEGDKFFDMFYVILSDEIYYDSLVKIANLSDDPTDNSATSVYTEKGKWRQMGFLDSTAQMTEINLYSDEDMKTHLPDGLYYITYQKIFGDIYQSGQLGADTSGKSVIGVSGGIATMWQKGLWSPVVTTLVYINFYITVEDNVITFLNVSIQNKKAQSVAYDIDVIIFNRSGQPVDILSRLVVSAAANSSESFQEGSNYYLSTDMTDIGLAGQVGTEVRLQGRTPIPRY